MLIDKIKATVVNKIAVLKDINGNKIIPMTLTKAVQDDNGKKLNVILDEKMGKVDVVNVDTQVESDGKALNAVQANPSITGTLAQQINVLNDERGYLSTSENCESIPISDWNNVIKNGRYMRMSALNSPPSDTGWFIVDVIAHNDYFITQIAYAFADSVIKQYTRNCMSGVWQPWQRYATTTKTSFICTPGTGITIAESFCYTQNNRAYVKIMLHKTDGSNFTSSETDVATVPFAVNRYTNASVSFLDISGLRLKPPVSYNCVLWKDGHIYVSFSDSTVRFAIIECEVDL